MVKGNTLTEMCARRLLKQFETYKTFVQIGDCFPNNLLMEDKVLLQFYDIVVRGFSE